MKRTDKEIKTAIKKLEEAHSMGGYRKSDKIAALEECLELDEEEIDAKIEEIIENDYEINAVYDWAINGRDSF
jgi:CRISPR/Cas system-associated endonuclease Cas3-HD